MKATTCKVTDKRYKEASKVLDKWRFIYEVLPSGNLRAEPMDFSINDKLLSQLSKAGYFTLTGRGYLIIKPN